MFQKNPLLLIESKRKLLRRLSRYSPEEVSRIREKMLALGKKNGGWYSADEYGRRMIAGQKLRGQKIAKKHGRRLLVVPYNQETANGYTQIDRDGGKIDLIGYTRNPFNSKKTLSKGLASELEEKGKERLSRKDIRKQYLRINNQKNPNLATGETLSHEMDEYSLGLQLPKKLNISLSDAPDAFGRLGGLNSTNLQSIRSSHNPGVLEREAKRMHLINTLYGRDAIPSYVRDSKQFASNKKKYILNNSKTKEFVGRFNLDKDVRYKAISKINRAELLKSIEKERKILRSLGIETKGKSFEDLDRLYQSKYSILKKDEFLEHEAQRLGIPKFVPDPKTGVRQFVPRFLRKDIPEGMVANPQFLKLSRQIDRKAQQLTFYLDNLEKLKKLSK